MRKAQSVHAAASLASAVFLLAVTNLSAQQPIQPKSSSASGNLAASTTNESDHSTKSKLLTSPTWKQINDEFQKWLTSQVIFTPADIQRINADLATQIETMPASELQAFIDDWQAKLKVLNGKDFQDAQQWLGEYLSVMADGFRRQTLTNFGLTDLPNLSAAQLEDAFVRVRAHRLASLQRRAAFDQNRQQMVQMVQQNNVATQQALQQRSTGAAQFGTNRSPYRPPRFDPPPAPRRQFFVDGNGRIGFMLPN